ncbi:TPA: replication initiation factor domain-containing protein [Neisseria weaveri]
MKDWQVNHASAGCDVPVGDAVAHGASEHAEGCPPRLIGGEQKQNPNLHGADEPVHFEYFSRYVTDSKGRFIEIPLRRGRDDGAFIDQITFTLHEDSIPKVAGTVFVSDTEYMVKYSEFLQDILGFGISGKLPYKGKFFYKTCYQLGPDNVEYGKVHYGGQRETILVELNGTGCMAAKAGWENRLYEFLKKCVRPKITRCDVAHDFFDGEYTPEQAMLDHDNGHYDIHNMRPKSQCSGTAWRKEDGSGKTFYIGKRGNSKYTRIYEKGRQLGDKNSKWVRFETEFRAGDIEIPLDILLYAGSYLGGAYPIGRSIFTGQAKRMTAMEKTVDLTLDHKMYYARNQVGKFVNFLRDIGWSSDEIVKALTYKVEGYPKGLMPEQYDCQTATLYCIHDEYPAIQALAPDPFMDGLVKDKTYEFPQDRSQEHAKDIDVEDSRISAMINREDDYYIYL